MKPTLFLALALAAVVPGHAAPSTEPAPQDLRELADRVTVSASGTAVGTDAELQLRVRLAATAELADQAVTDFAQARTRAEAALRDLGFAGLALESRGAKLSYVAEPDANAMQNMVFMGGVETPAYGATCAEDLLVRFAAAEGTDDARRQLAAALDTAVELGLSVPSSPAANPYIYLQGVTEVPTEAAVTGVLGDDAYFALEREAQADALARATRSARSLADLSGRQLGGVLDITAARTRRTWEGLGTGTRLDVDLVVTFELK